MIAALRLLPLLIRRAPRQAAGAAALCAAGVAAATLVAATVIAAWAGLGEREARFVWREPVPAASDERATALQRRSLELFDEREIHVVELAATAPGAAGLAAIPVPPGLRAVPGPGSAVVSPALARLIAATPSDQLGDRFGRVVGTIGDAGLARPDELVAVLGRTAAAIGPVDSQEIGSSPQMRGPGVASAVTPITRYDTTQQDNDLQVYREMALVAVVLVAVPALMLVGSAARLTAARRELRLAAIRLAGATPGAVRVQAAAETALGAVAGAIVGVGASLFLAPALRGVPIAGGQWFTSDLRLDAARAAGLAAAAGLVSVAAAVLSLRRVASAPLGVARSAEPQRARWPRLLGLGVALVGLVLSTLLARGGSSGEAVVMIAALGIVIGSLGLGGPWICSVVGRTIARFARVPSTLIAGRRIADDPKAAYRVVSSVVLAGLIAGFLAGVLPTAEAKDDRYGSTDELSISLPTADAEAVLAFDLPTRFAGTTVEQVGVGSDPAGNETVDLAITPGAGASVEQLRTITAPIRHGNPLVSSRDDLWSQATLVGDVRRGSLVVLIAGLLLAAASSAVAAAASVVDQRRTIGRLALTGVPIEMLQAARRWQTTVPLVAATTGAIAVGLGGGIALMLGFGQSSEGLVPPETLQLVAAIVGAAGIGLVSAAITRPLLVNAARSGTATPE